MLIRLWLAAICLTISAVPLSAQTGVGQIQGTVTDATGAVIPGAAVTLINIRTDTRFQTITTEAGSFVFPTLVPAEYRLTVAAPGMQRWEGTTKLVAGQRAVIDATLQVGLATEQVTVAGNVTPLLSTSSPTVATIVERQRIEQLPLNGRSIQTLLSISVPGLEGNASQPKIFGLRDSAMAVLQDGVNLQDRNTGSIQSRPPGLDTIDEFRVETAVSSAKLTRPASAIMITRSGSNVVHGSLFSTGRNSGFGVARQRQDTFTKAPHLVRNEFGASIGAPVYIPKLYNGKNRTFFFAAWEELRQRQAATTTSAVWTGAMRVGDFSGLIDGQNRRVTLYDPWSVGAGPNYVKVPYNNNQLPMARLSPIAKYMFGVSPLPTNTLSPLVGSNLTALAPVVQNQRTFTTRIDHNISEKDRVFGRYSPGHWDLLQRRGFSTGGFPITSDGLYNRETYLEPSHTAMASWTHVFGPKLFVESVFTSSLIHWLYSHDQASSQPNISGMFGTPNPFNQPGAPYINNALYQGVSLNGIVPRTQYTQVFSGEQNYSWSTGKHQVEFGWRYQDDTLDTLPDAPAQSVLSYASNATALYNPATGTAFGSQAVTGDNGANFFLGIADSYQQTRRPQNFNMRGRELGAYIQDNYKLRHDFTLNLGVRWQYLGPYVDENGMTAGFDFASKSLVRNVTIQQLIDRGYTTKAIADGFAAAGVKYTTPSQAGFPDDIVSASKRDLSPRIGFAYNPRLGGKPLVIRGGYGLYLFPIPARTFSELRLNAPMQGSYRLSWNDPADTVDGLPNSLLRRAPDVITGVNSANAIRIAPPTPGIQMTALNPDLPTARAHQFNFTVEHEVLKNTVVRAGFVMTNGRKLEMMELFNRNPVSNYVWFVNTGLPLPTGTYANTARRAYDQTTIGDIRVYSKFGYSNYAGIQLEAERRFSRGMAFQFFYVVSNSMSTGATPSQGGDFTVNAIDQSDRFLRGAYPSSVEDRVRFYRYARDGDIPKHRIRFNYLLDLPLGRGRRFANNASSAVNHLIGGWQVAGYGASNSRWFSLPNNLFGGVSPVSNYGNTPITDCRGGACFAGYMYYNGYLPATVIADGSGRCAASPTACVFGVPSGYVPVSRPINQAVIGGDANFNNNNNVIVRLNNGNNQTVAYDNGLNPLRNQWVGGPWITNLSASVYKTVDLTERLKLRFNLDAFNVLNQPGVGNPSTEGIISLRNSAQGARVLQYTARLTW
ncbi:MAG: carboxypeptidase regulatory-like domain-containing protein [Acidobacteria bacterium]|nr:carboxypeptidase regulatory-like domain-containing protein [Acidobacteriota bacterium]